MNNGKLFSLREVNIGSLIDLTKFCAANQMPTKPQAKSPGEKPTLNKREVRLALFHRDWTQADLANKIGKSLTTTNLAINHGTFPDVVIAIREELSL